MIFNSCLKICAIIVIVAVFSSCYKKRIAVVNINGAYVGFEEMCETDSITGKKSCYMDSNPKEKWFYKSYLQVKSDSVFLDQSPVTINGKDTSFSASDGGFYYYKGLIKHKDKLVVIKLVEYACDYCGELVKKNADGTFTRIYRKKKLSGSLENGALILNGITFRKLAKDKERKRNTIR
jgi:hypothetical protein